MGLEWERGKELEVQIKEILNKHNINFKHNLSLTDFGLIADFLINKDKDFYVIESTLRNSIEDIQRLCFRSIVYKEYFEGKVRTIVVLPKFTNKSLRHLMFVLRFFDYFVFTEDLKILPRLINCTDRKSVFFGYLKTKLKEVYPETEKLLEILYLNKGNLLTIKEIEEKSQLDKSIIKKLLCGLSENLVKLGIVENIGNYYRLTERFA
jgi:predicted transcriptional regulator